MLMLNSSRYLLHLKIEMEHFYKIIIISILFHIILSRLAFNNFYEKGINLSN